MPKKDKKKKNIEKEEDSALEELIEEEKSEEIAEDPRDESEGIIFDDVDFDNFVQQSGRSSAPVLERIAGNQELQWARTEASSKENLSRTTDNSKGNLFNYDSRISNEEREPEYISTSRMNQDMPNVNFDDVGRGNAGQTPIQEVQLMRSMELENKNSMYEKYSSPERIDTEKAGRENPFEKKFERTVERKKSEYITK